MASRRQRAGGLVLLLTLLGWLAACSDLNGDREIYPATERPPLELADICPDDKSSDFYTGGVIRLLFSKPLNPATVTQSSFMLGEGRRLIRGSITLNEGIVTYVPREILHPATRYDLYVTSELRDTDGFAITNGFLSFSFTTGAPGSVSCR